MKRPALLEFVVFVTLLTSGVLLRLRLQELPNFAPVAAIALFSGFYFRSWVVAALLPLGIMGVSDYWIGGYELKLMLLVYAMLALPIACRQLLRRGFGSENGLSTVNWLAGLLGCSLGASCVFYLATNFGTWMWGDLYEPTWSGLLACYAAALPFFRYTLAGDLFFAVVLFGGYAWAWSAGMLPALRASPCPPDSAVS